MARKKKEETYEGRLVESRGSFEALVKNIPVHIFAGAVQKSGMPASEARRLTLLFKEL